MGVIPNPKMAFIFPISCILALIFPILIKYFPKCVGKGSFPKSQIKSLMIHEILKYENIFILLEKMGKQYSQTPLKSPTMFRKYCVAVFRVTSVSHKEE